MEKFKKKFKAYHIYRLILGALEVIDNARMIILYLSGYLMFQIITGIIIFNKLMKKY